MLSRGVHPLKQLSLLDSLRVWAAVTGLLLALGYFAVFFLADVTSQTLPLLITAIGGFEMFLYGQDLWLKRRSRHG